MGEREEPRGWGMPWLGGCVCSECVPSPGTAHGEVSLEEEVVGLSLHLRTSMPTLSLQQ